MSTKGRMKLDLCISPVTRMNSKWIKDLSIRPGPMKPPEENIMLQGTGIGKDFFE